MPERKKSHIAWIWDIWKERKGLIAILFALTLLSSAVAVTIPYLLKLLVDMLQALLLKPEATVDSFLKIRSYALLFVVVGLVQLVAGLFPGVRGAMNIIFDFLIRRRFFGIVMRKDYRFFASFRSGDVVTRLTDDINDFPKLSWFLCSGIFRAVESISKVIFCLTAMALINWKLTLLSLIPLPLMIVAFAIAQDRIYDTFRRNQEAISDINSQLEMSFSGVRIIKAYGCEGKYSRFFRDALQKRFGTEMEVVKLQAILMIIYQYIDKIMQIGILFAGGFMFFSGDITMGTFYAFYNYLGMLIYPILDIPQLFVSGKRAFVNIDRLEEMKNHPDRAEGTGTGTIEKVDRIDIQDLGFTYEGRTEAALDGVSFSLARGEKLAVIGPVGSGKTTLVKLISGLLEPRAGTLSLNGLDLRSIEPAALSAITGYVPQEALLFSGTIRDNIAFGSPGDGKAIDDEHYTQAVSIAQIQDEVAAFLDGENTLLGQRGVSVSGGQRQRLAIARAIARRPKLLLLDDITASLDAANESRLMQALDDWSADLSCIVVSHRLSTLQYADKVLFLDGGRSLAFGKHEELLRENGAYAAFIEEHLALATGGN